MKNRLRECREEAGLKQHELARLVNVSSKAISSYETGKREPDIATWESLAKALHVIPAYLIGWSDKPLCQVIDKAARLTEKQKNCPYCHVGSNLKSIYFKFGREMVWDEYGFNFNEVDSPLVQNDGRDCYGDITFDPVYKKLVSYGEGTDPLIVHINYCPMCGRPLNEEKD